MPLAVAPVEWHKEIPLSLKSARQRGNIPELMKRSIASKLAGPDLRETYIRWTYLCSSSQRNQRGLFRDGRTEPCGAERTRMRKISGGSIACPCSPGSATTRQDPNVSKGESPSHAHGGLRLFPQPTTAGRPRSLRMHESGGLRSRSAKTHLKPLILQTVRRNHASSARRPLSKNVIPSSGLKSRVKEINVSQSTLRAMNRGLGFVC